MPGKILGATKHVSKILKGNKICDEEQWWDRWGRGSKFDHQRANVGYFGAAHVKRRINYQVWILFLQFLENLSQFFEESDGTDVTRHCVVVKVQVIVFQTFDEVAKLKKS